MSKIPENRQSYKRSIEAAGRSPKTGRNIGTAALLLTAALAGDAIHSYVDSNEPSPQAVDVGNNVIYPTAGRVTHALIEAPNAKNKGKELVLHFAVTDPGYPDDISNSTLSNFAYDVGWANGIKNITGPEGVALTTEAISATSTDNQSDSTGGNVEYGMPYFVKVSPKTNLHDLEVFAKQDDIKVKPA